METGNGDGRKEGRGVRSRHKEPRMGTGTEEGSGTGKGHRDGHRTQEREQAPARARASGPVREAPLPAPGRGFWGAPGSRPGGAGPRGSPRTEPQAPPRWEPGVSPGLVPSRPVPPGAAGLGAAPPPGAGAGRARGGLRERGSAPGCGESGSARLHREDAGPGTVRAGGPGPAPVPCRCRGAGAGVPQNPHSGVEGDGTGAHRPRSPPVSRGRSSPWPPGHCPLSPERGWRRSSSGSSRRPPGRVPGSVPPCGAAACRDMPRHA